MILGAVLPIVGASIVLASGAVTTTGYGGNLVYAHSVAEDATYEVTITNITPGQPITPPLLVTHRADVGVFTVGEEASEELQQLAENGDFGPLVESLEEESSVFDVVTGTAPLVPANDPGDTGMAHSATFTVRADGNHGHLSFASMLICTNDGFAGVDGVHLPHYGVKTIYTAAYDARTEANTEDFADLVPPCQGLTGVSGESSGTGASNPAISEDGIVIPHPGIEGEADLTFAHDWADPVVKIEIKRLS